jgi:hypothetical protein
MSTSFAIHRPPRGAWLDRLVHPIPVGALIVLLLNDHVLKATYPSWLTGKLSDVAVLVLLPFLVLAAADLVALRFRHLPAPGSAALLASVVIAAAVFTLIEVVPIGADAYRWGLGLAQWPIRAMVAATQGAPLPDLLPVRLTSDVTDLLTLPAAGLILWLRWAVPRAGRTSSGRSPWRPRRGRRAPSPQFPRF